MRSIPSLAAATVLLLAAYGARAESGSGSESERSRFSFHPSIRITAVADSNVRLQKDDSDGDLGVFFFPRVELGYQTNGLELGADLGADIRRFVDDSSPSEEFFRIGGFAEFGLGPGFTLRISDAYAPTPVDLGKPEDHAANLVQTNRAAASFRYGRDLPGGHELMLSLQGTRLISEGFSADVGTGVVDDHFHADFWEAALIGEIQSPLGDRTTLFFRAHTRYRSFDDSSASASEFGDFAVLLGVRTHWFKNIDFDVAGGFGRLAFDSRRKDRFLGHANVRYRVSDGTTV